MNLCSVYYWYFDAHPPLPISTTHTGPAAHVGRYFSQWWDCPSPCWHLLSQAREVCAAHCGMEHQGCLSAGDFYNWRGNEWYLCESVSVCCVHVGACMHCVVCICLCKCARSRFHVRKIFTPPFRLQLASWWGWDSEDRRSLSLYGWGGQLQLALCVPLWVHCIGEGHGHQKEGGRGNNFLTLHCAERVVYVCLLVLFVAGCIYV